MNLVFKTKPWPHQRAAVEYFMGRDTAALYTKPGSGKTKIMLDTIVNKCFRRVLIVAPKKAAESVWPSEIKLHTDIPSENVLELAGKSLVGKLSLLSRLANTWQNTVPQLVICNYDCIYEKQLRDTLANKVHFDCVICDESHRIKAPGGKISLALFYIGKRVKHRYLVTGTPFADKPADIYSQYRFLDTSIFGTNYSNFSAQYINLDPFLSARLGKPIPDRNTPYKNLDDMHEKVYSCAFTAEATIVLPKTHRKMVRFEADPVMCGLYAELDSEGIADVNDEYSIETNNALAKKSAQQRILSGYVKAVNILMEDKIFKVSNAREKCLYKLLKTLTGRIVVFYKYDTDKTSIKHVCDRIGLTHCEISGHVNEIDLWNKQDINLVMVQYNAGSEGISLVQANNCVYYTLHHSLAFYEQSLKRLHRPGQTQEVTYYHIIGLVGNKKSVDEEIMECLKSKKHWVNEVKAGNYQ